MILPTVVWQPCDTAAARAATITSAAAEQGIMAVGHSGRAGMVGLAGEVEPPAPMGPDVAGHADRSIEIDQAAALLDVQLDEAADPRQRLGVAPDAVRPSSSAA